MSIMSVQLKRFLNHQGVSEFWACYRSVAIALCSVSAIGPRDEIAELATGELEPNPGTATDQ